MKGPESPPPGQPSGERAPPAAPRPQAETGLPAAGQPGAGLPAASQAEAGLPAAGQAEAGPPPAPASEPHPDIAPLSFLLGRWQGAGVGGYPTIESFRFGQELSFSHNGKPFLIYSSRSWLIGEDGMPGRPLAMETGFWRPQPDGEVELVLAHPTGITEIYLGRITGTRIELSTDVVTRTASAKEVTTGHRLYGLVGADLAYAYDMATAGQGLQPHLSARLKRPEAG